MGRGGDMPWWADAIIIPTLNLLSAFLITGIMLFAIGENPIECVEILVSGAFGNAQNISYTLFYATDFIFAGLAFAVAFHAGLFNIGGEGQAYVAGIGVALVCLGFPTWPQPLLILIALPAAAVFGAAWAFIPAYLQAKRGSHLVITTMMFNFIASALMVYLLNGVLKRPESQAPETSTFVPNARLPLLQDIAAALNIPFPESPLNLAFFWALICAFAVSVLIWRTRIGYELRTLGASPPAAVYAGMSPTRVTIIAMMLSGALASFIAVNEVMGSQNRLYLDFTSGAGFTGIAVALMGRSRSLGIVLAATLFGALYQGGAELALEKNNIPRDLVILVQGLVILMAGALEHMYRPFVSRLFQGGLARSKDVSAQPSRPASGATS
jgi:simple sugar transport system permease protein